MIFFYLFFIKISLSKYIVNIKSFLDINDYIDYEILTDSHILIDDKHYNFFLNHKHTNFIEKNLIVKSHSICTKSWGIDRINQFDLPLDNLYNLTTNNSSNIDIYVIDTGININHPQFLHKKPTILETFGSNNPDDCNGHGTHVAGIIGGKNTGISPNANIFSIKIDNDCTGSAYCSDMIKSITLATNRMISTGKKSIINLSFGVCYSVVQELNKFMNKGGIVSLSSGNDGQDITNDNNYKYFDTLNGFIVGATDKYDNLAYYSNYGDNVYIYAPGSSILSIEYDTQNCIELSGTSMAAPFVTAISAIYWNLYSTRYNNQIIYNLKFFANKNKITNNKNIHNNLIYLSDNITNIDSNNTLLIFMIFFFIIFIFICIFCRRKKNLHNRRIPVLFNNLRIIPGNFNNENSNSEGKEFDIENQNPMNIHAEVIKNISIEGNNNIDVKNNKLLIENNVDESTPIPFT